MTKTNPGNFFEDFRLGQRIEHATPRTVTQADATLYLAITGGRNPVHFAAPVAAALGHRAVPLDDLLDLVTRMVIVFGLSFELPLLLIIVVVVLLFRGGY